MNAAINGPVPAVEGGDENKPFLQLLGERVRQARARRGMSRKSLAKDADISERYLAQLENGEGNISILLLRKVARALDMSLATLTKEHSEPSIELAPTFELLRRLRPEQHAEAYRLLLGAFSVLDAEARQRRIALIGLRGAGKTTLGSMLAERLSVPFIELDREIERESSLSLAAIFDIYGQSGFRRLERRCLDRVIAEQNRFVLATSGSIVSDPANFERLLANCYTIWLRASPEEHMERVIAQGDLRPMGDSTEAMEDLRRILASRESLYREADAEVDTSGRNLRLSLETLLERISARRES